MRTRSKAEKKGLPKADLARVVERFRWLEEDLRGDVKRLSNHFPEYRMRAGDYRSLVEVDGDQVIM